jgi:3-deoxy-manno-octulosonate cytidylyltransferase (CMP-KDO synthetase)
MAATRLPGKPLLDIAGLPMIVHVLRRAEAAGIGRVAVATDTPDIAVAVMAHGGEAVMTHADHPSGSDRIFEALGKLDPKGDAEIIVNLQGDFPTIGSDNISSVLGPLADPTVDIATLAAEIHTEEESGNPNVSPRRAGTLCRPASLGAGTAGKARTIAGAGGRHADRRHHRRHGAARRRYAGRPRNRPARTGENLNG